jgi:Protein of unknown function (DUF3617)
MSEESPMKHPLLPWATLAAFALSTALAAEFTMRPGRWEVTLEMKFPEQMLARMPGNEPGEPTKGIDCLTEEVSLERMLVQLPDESCRIGNYRHDGAVMQFVLNCDDVAVDYRVVRHSADSYSATGVSRNEDPTQRVTFTSSAKRTGSACSAKELAEDKANEE